jgi:isoleucyl-tRNA synthetase
MPSPIRLTYDHLQSSFTPFLSEHIYQSLRLFFVNSSSFGLGEDDRSVHFVPFPTVRQEYFDPVVERQVGRMQNVINLGRVIRERNTLPLKVGCIAQLKTQLTR